MALDPTPAALRQFVLDENGEESDRRHHAFIGSLKTTGIRCRLGVLSSPAELVAIAASTCFSDPVPMFGAIFAVTIPSVEIALHHLAGLTLVVAACGSEPQASKGVSVSRWRLRLVNGNPVHAS